MDERRAAYAPGDRVIYYRLHGDKCDAEVLSVSPLGRLRLRVHQGGAVPYYTANNVQFTSVIKAAPLLESEAKEPTHG